MYYGYNISDYTAQLAKKAEADLTEVFQKIEENALICSAKVLRAFQECRVSTADFLEITGYGYTDSGRDKLEEIYAKVFGAEDALVRPQLMSGTHALSVTLGGLLKHGDTLLYISGVQLMPARQACLLSATRSQSGSFSLYRRIEIFREVTRF